MRISLAAFFALCGLVACGGAKEADPVYEGSASAHVSTDDIAHWNQAYGWGDHADAGYLKQESDPQFAASSAATITSGDLASWNQAVAWGNHAAAGYLKTESDPLFSASPVASVGATDLANWNAAFGWGNHAAAGYLKTESDPLFSAAPASSIAASDLAHWNAAYGWGDHAAAGYLKTETDPKIGNLTTNALPRWNGTQLVNGAVTDTGSAVGIGTASPSAVLDVWGVSVSASGDQAQGSTPSYIQTDVVGVDVIQSFTPGVSGALAYVTLDNQLVDSTVTLKVSSTQTGPALASETCHFAMTGWQECRFTNPPTLTAGSAYYLHVVVGPGGMQLGYSPDPNSYPRGAILSFGIPGDLAFITHMGTPVAVPVLQVGTSVNVNTLLHLQPGAQPATPQEGDVYFDSALKKLRYWNGSGWTNL